MRRNTTIAIVVLMLVIVGAVLWLPISFGVATFMHAALIAKAMSLPAWMQFLHPLATIIAKSKLLVLPVYPAAWPQAKQHPFTQAMIHYYRFIAGLSFMQKMGYRYRQMDQAVMRAREALARAAASVGLDRLGSTLLNAFNAAAVWVGTACRDAIAYQNGTSPPQIVMTLGTTTCDLGTIGTICSDTDSVDLVAMLRRYRLASRADAHPEHRRPPIPVAGHGRRQVPDLTDLLRGLVRQVEPPQPRGHRIRRVPAAVP